MSVTSNISDARVTTYATPSPTSPLNREERVDLLFKEKAFNSFSIFLLGGLFVGLLWYLAFKGIPTHHIATPVSLALAGAGTALWLAFFINSVKECSKFYKKDT